MELTGLAKTNAYRYLSVLNNPNLRKFIDNGDINTLRAASILLISKMRENYQTPLVNIKRGRNKLNNKNH